MTNVVSADQAARQLEKIFVCEICGEEFQTQQKGLRHLENCYSIDQDPTVTRVKQ